jgi:hypothetical protein
VLLPAGTCHAIFGGFGGASSSIGSSLVGGVHQGGVARINDQNDKSYSSHCGFQVIKPMLLFVVGLTANFSGQFSLFLWHSTVPSRYQIFMDRVSLFDTIEPRPLSTPALEPHALKPRSIGKSKTRFVVWMTWCGLCLRCRG